MLDNFFKNLFSKEKSDINLLPKDERVNLTKGTVFLVTLIITTTAFLTLGAYILKQTKSQNLSSIQSNINQLETGEWKKVKEIATLLSSVKFKISNYQKFATDYPSIDKKVELLAQTLPQKVKLLNILVDSTGKVSTSAIAEKPEDINFWRNEMKGRKEFKNIIISSITKGGENYTFSASLEIQ
jgi:hypothetical protein